MAVLRTLLLFPAAYHTIPDTASNTSKFRNIDPETSHIPAKKRAEIDKSAFFVTLLEENEYLTAKMKSTMSMIICITTPELDGIPSVLTKNRSNLEEIVTTPGIIPYINRARRITEDVNEITSPFHENSYFLK
jgi:hypothetical protein